MTLDQKMDKILEIFKFDKDDWSCNITKNEIVTQVNDIDQKTDTIDSTLDDQTNQLENIIDLLTDLTTDIKTLTLDVEQIKEDLDD